MTDQVNHPNHYTSHPSGVEAIDVCEFIGFNCGNAFKYLFRRGQKHDSPFADLRKAIWYIRREAIASNEGVYITVHDLPEPKRGDFGPEFFDELCLPDLVDRVCSIVTHEPPLIAGAMAYLVRGYETGNAIDLFMALNYVEQEIACLTH